jgi:cytochrome c-type biogenesis protein
LAYCLGLGIPFILIAAGLGWANRTVRFLRAHIRTVNIIGGGILVATGVAMLTGVWTRVMYALQGLIAGNVMPL